ncbi:2,3-dihydroxybenzoate-AMP ligase [Methylobacillus rhizosphaerae]|uniref:2,3-dihydroxybenzoate-AMP ligase n=1 Tax=Methylobacillus rhizosphaerae TaxID=551994 RepID=A0A238YY16_9PROT|nr:(2,3-dihydroxybenzoyl)adenylate synthase [Methylobacillus rhizosphaerae]SNR75892.1 2,3-dihydroxybenzoate-AMP ligase [Methylobacillus rhizosphaerae]
MLPHCTAWPENLAARYRTAGYWRGETFSDMLQARIEQDAQHIAVVSDRHRWSYQQLGQEVDRLARGFHAMGITANDPVVVQLPNCAEFIAVIFALFRLGALPVFALPAHRQFEIEHFCRHTGAVAYIIADQHGDFDYRVLARKLKQEVDTLRHVLVLGEAQEFTPLGVMPSWDGDLPAGPQAGEVAFFQLSGGSTGTPKLIPRTHDDYLYSVRASAEICGLGPDSVYLSVIPAGHNFSLSSPGSLGTLYAGGTVVMSAHPSPDVALPWIAREGVTMTALVPPLVPVWLDAIQATSPGLSSLKVVQVGGACFSSTMANRLVQELGVTLQQVFGMAEGLVNYTRLDDPLDVVLHSQGRPISPDDEVLVVDDDDQPVAAGEIGHLLTRGPYTIRGYYRADEHNARAFTADGYYRTGDMVRMTPEGNLVVEGRNKDQINRGGEKISAEEVEHQLLAHQGVADCAVVAMPDAYLGEKTCAFVIRRDASLRSIDFIRFLRERGLATYKIPDRIEFVSQLPKTGVGKINKKLLRQQISMQLSVPAAMAI